MMFTRTLASFRRQDWAAVLVELVIVVLGVFIGLQVDNWNQARADARLGRDYVKRLTRELQQDRAAIHAEITYYTAVLDSIQRADALLVDAHPEPRALVVTVYRGTEIIYTPPVRATWDQIVSSGHLGLLPEHAVETSLSQYYAFDTGRDVYSMGLNSAYRQAVRKVIPVPIQIAIRAGCSDERDAHNLIVGFAKGCKLDADPAAVARAAEALRSNPDVIADLRYQYSFAISAVLNLRSVESTIDDALAALGVKPVVAPGAS